MKKVLIVFNHPAPYKVRLFNELSKSFDLHVIFERNTVGGRNKDFYFEQHFAFTRHIIKGFKFQKENFISRDIVKHIKQNQYDLIIMNGYSQFAEMAAIRYLKRKNIPYVMYINGGTIKNESKFKKNIKTKYISGASAYLSPDAESNKYLIYYGADKNRIFNYPYSTIFASEIFEDPKMKKKYIDDLGIKFDKVFVSAGQLIERKNYIELVKEWINMPENYGLYIIGDGVQRNKINEIIQENHMKNVVLTGFLPREIVFKYFRAADAFLFPSKQDIYGHVINEALSQGLPIISSNSVNAATNLIDDGKNGFVLNEFNFEQLKTAIDKVLSYNMHDDCISVAKENTIEKMAEKHVEIFNEVLAK